MGEHKIVSENRNFGLYLRRIRKDRRLSLDAVEEMTVDYPEPVTKSHLSRIENGRAVPTFPRMFALCQVYGVPIASMAERFETDLRMDGELENTLDPDQPEPFLDELRVLRNQGRYDRMLQLTSSALDTLKSAAEPAGNELVWSLSIWRLGAMEILGQYESCKIHGEELLSVIPEESEFHLRALVSFVVCSYRLRRSTVAVMGLTRLDSLLAGASWPPDLLAIAHSTRGEVFHALGKYDEAKTSFERALTAYREVGDERAVCKTRLNLGQLLIDMERLGAAKHYLLRGLSEAKKHGYERQLALANGHLALLYFKAGEFDIAEPFALRSNALARSLEFTTLIFRNCYYLWKLATLREDEAAVRTNERTLSALSNRVPHDLPEVDLYRSFARGDDR